MVLPSKDRVQSVNPAFTEDRGSQSKLPETMKQVSGYTGKRTQIFDIKN